MKSLRVFSAIVFVILIVAMHDAVGGDVLSPLDVARNDEARSIGTGDGRIHVIPSLYPDSIKDGEKLTVSVLVKSQLPVRSVVANLGGLASIELKRSARSAGAGLGES